MNSRSEKLPYSELLRVAWFLAWRTTALSLAVSLIVSVPTTTLSILAGQEGPSLLAAPLGLLGTMFVALPLVVRMMLKKSFDGFSLMVTRRDTI